MEEREKSLDSRKQELSKKYGIDFDKLEREQIKLAKGLEIKDKIDFNLAEKFGAVESIFIKNKILSCIIVCDKNYEVVDRAYVFDKVRFPYFPGFRAYRELPAMVEAFEKLNEKPDVVFVSGQGLIHPRLGLASHFSLSTGIPTIGVSNSLLDCKIDGDVEDGADILKEDKENFEKTKNSKSSKKDLEEISFGKANYSKSSKKIGKVLITKPGSNPMFISPGDKIIVKSAYEISKNLINLPHKRPEPMHLVSKYAKEVRKELVVEG